MHLAYRLHVLVAGIMRALSSVCPDYVYIPKFCSLAVTLLTVLKNVSMEPSTLEVISVQSNRRVCSRVHTEPDGQFLLHGPDRDLSDLRYE